MFVPFLKVRAEGKDYAIKEIILAIAESMKLPNEDREDCYPTAISGYRLGELMNEYNIGIFGFLTFVFQKIDTE